MMLTIIKFRYLGSIRVSGQSELCSEFGDELGQ